MIKVYKVGRGKQEIVGLFDDLIEALNVAAPVKAYVTVEEEDLSNDHGFVFFELKDNKPTISIPYDDYIPLDDLVSIIKKYYPLGKKKLRNKKGKKPPDRGILYFENGSKIDFSSSPIEEERLRGVEF